MTQPGRKRLAWALLLLSPALFGVNILLSRYALFVPPNALALGRWLCVALRALRVRVAGRGSRRGAGWGLPGRSRLSGR